MKSLKMTNLIPNKIGNKLAMLYENWIIPPQNESLIEIKRREFREKVKYLDPKVLYTLSEEEKSELRLQGYYVDLDEKTISEIKNFKLKINRHLNKYNMDVWNNNFAIYNTKYYYTDQNHHHFWGDPNYFKKIWRNRTRFKFKLSLVVIGYMLFYAYYKYRLNHHINTRKMIKKMAENNPNILMPVENIP